MAKDIKQKEEMLILIVDKNKDLALITALILNEDILGGTIFQTFDRAYAIAINFQYIYPHDFDWEGEDIDFDEAVILFTKKVLEDEIQ